MKSALPPLLFVFLLVLPALVSSQLSITTLNTAVTEDFSGFDGSGFAPAPAAGQLDSDTWRVKGLSEGDMMFGDTKTSGDFARGSSMGGVTTGGVYSFDVGGGNTVLGVQPGGSDFAPGDFTLKIQNNTGSTITELEISYDIYVYNDQDRANSFNFAHSSDDNSSYTAEPGLNYTTPEAADPSPAWVSVSQSITLTGLSIADGGSYFLQWQSDDVSGSGSRDEVGLDNVSITANPTTVTTLTATPTSLSDLDYSEEDGPSAEQSFSLSGTALNGSDVTLSAPSNFEISTMSGGTFGSSITLTSYDGSDTVIYVRLQSGLSAGIYNQDLTISGGGASQIDVNLEGFVSSSSAISIPSEPYTYTQDFTGFDGSSDLTDWVTEDVTDMSAWQGTGSGTSNTGGKYSFGDTGSGATFEGSLGFLPSASRAINVIIEFTNNSGGILENFLISYTAEHWRSAFNGYNNGWEVSYAIDGVDQGTLSDLTYIAPNDIATGGGPHGSETLTQIVLGADIQDGETITITFFGDNGTGSGSRQGVAIDEFEFTASNDANLPVEWLTFEARKHPSQEAVHLNWSVAREELHDFYELQRSTDGTYWTVLGQVRETRLVSSAEGRTGNRHYDFIDASPSEGLNLYRIRQVDIDGAEDFSIIRKVLFFKNETDFGMAPVPARDRLYFTWPADWQKEQLELELINMQGQAQTIFRGDAPADLRLPALTAGLYQLLVRDAQGRILARKRVVIQ